MRRILIIDDDSVNREIFRWALGAEFEIHEMKSGIGAADRISGGDYDLVVLDLMMPVVDGVEVVKDLAHVDQSALARVLVVTAALNTHATEQLSGYPLAGIAARPYDPDEIKVLVGRHLQ
jgi:CheY-like chemotaxis protein